MSIALFPIVQPKTSKVIKNVIANNMSSRKKLVGKRRRFICIDSFVSCLVATDARITE